MHILEVGTGIEYPPKTHRETLVASEEAGLLYDYVTSAVEVMLCMEQPLSTSVTWELNSNGEWFMKMTTQPHGALLPKVTWFIIRPIGVLE